MTREVFDEFVRQSGRMLYRHAFRFLRNQEEAEDAVQEVMVKLWKLGDKLDGYSSITAFATTTLKNHCIDIIRKNKTFVTDTLYEQTLNISDPETPARVLENRETATMLHKIIENLPELYRDIVNQKDIQDLSYEEIAEITGQNINTLRVNLSRARQMIRDEIKRKRND